MKKLIVNQKYQFRVNYYADSDGHIWSEHNQKYLSEQLDKNGYHKVTLMTTDKPEGKGHRFSVHRLILSTFKPILNSEVMSVDHIDGNIDNNCLDNLRWVCIKENLDNPNTKPNRRCYDQDGINNASAKFTTKTLNELINDINSGKFKRKEILNKYDICDETLSNIIQRRTYKQELIDKVINPRFLNDYARDTKGSKNGRAKLTEPQVLEIIEMLQSNKYKDAEIARYFNISTSTICNIKKKRTWKHLTEHITFN